MSNKRTTEPIRFPITVYHLNLFIIYLRSYSNFINGNKLSNLNDLIQNIDPSIYESDLELSARIAYIKELLKYRMELHKPADDAAIEIIKTTSSCGEYIDEINETVAELINPPANWESIPDEDIIYISKIFDDILKFSFLFNDIDILDDLSLKFKSDSYENISDICESYDKLISKLHRKFRETETQSKDALNDFNSNDIESLTRAVDNTRKELTSPLSKIKTSIKLKNQMLNGGYESSRFYLVVGLQGGGKSGELLRIAMDAKKLIDVKSLPDDKIPVILFVSQENSIRETLERIWSFYMSNSSDLKGFSTAEILKILNENGFNEGPELHIKYRASKSISTKDIDNMINDIESTGEKRVVMVIQDYLKRIRSVKNVQNLYEELGEVCDEFCTIAKSRNIPIVSAMQFNRDGLKRIEEAITKKKNDPLKTLSSSDIGESLKIIDNCDVIYSIFTQPDIENEGRFLQSIKLLKYRGKRPVGEKPIEYFLHPFAEDNSMKLEPDINLPKSLSRLNINSELDNIDVAQLRNDKKVASNAGGRFNGGGFKELKPKKVNNDDILTDE